MKKLPILTCWTVFFQTS